MLNMFQIECRCFAVFIMPGAKLYAFVLAQKQIRTQTIRPGIEQLRIFIQTFSSVLLYALLILAMRMTEIGKSSHRVQAEFRRLCTIALEFKQYLRFSHLICE